MSTKRNCNAEQRFRVLAKIPNASGALARPTSAGQVTGLRMRISATENGPAIHPNVDALAATEETGLVGALYVVVSQSDMQTHVLPLGVDVPFFTIWYKAGVADYLTRRFIVTDRTVI